MATVHVGRLVGPAGFSRTVAIKRLHTQYLHDREFVAMFLDEARLAARIQHPNVVSIIDVVAEQGELLLVMDYIPGESLSALLHASTDRGPRVEPKHAVKIITDVLHGLHAAHETTGSDGLPAGIVHRDVSPQNIVVGVDGMAHLIDFGVAKAVDRIQSTQNGQLKGKLAYMAPEQLHGGRCDRRSDVFAAGVVLWEMLTGQRLFRGDDANLVYAVLYTPIQKPSAFAPDLGPRLDAVLLKALQRSPENRFATALEMAAALEAAEPPASSIDVARWVRGMAATELDRRARMVSELERVSDVRASLAVLDQALDGSSATPAGHPRPPETVRTPDGTQAPLLDGDSAASRPRAARLPAHPRRMWLAALGASAVLLALGTLGLVLASVRASGDDPPEPTPVTSYAPVPILSTFPSAPAASTTSSAPTIVSAVVQPSVSISAPAPRLTRNVPMSPSAKETGKVQHQRD